MKRKREVSICEELKEDKQRRTRQKLGNTEDKPLRYLLVYTHSLIENYEEIIRDSWIKALQFIIKPKIECLLYKNISTFFNEIEISTFVEDDIIELLFEFIKKHQTKYKENIINCNDKELKYYLMRLKDDFFEDNMHKINLKKGMRILLREIKEELKWSMCLIHKDSRNTMNLILNDIGLRGYFNAFVCSTSIASHRRPYLQIYDQCMSRCRIFKQQSIILCNYPIEANEAIYYGLYPILINNNKNIKLYGKYFIVKQDKKWINHLKNILIKLKEYNNDNITDIVQCIDNHYCLQSQNHCKFLHEAENGKIYNGIIDKQFSEPPYPIIFRIKYNDNENNIKSCLKQNFLIWRE